MHKHTEIAVSALISIMVAVPCAAGAPAKKTLVSLPYAIPHMMPAGVVRPRVSLEQQRQSMRAMVRSSYPSTHFQRGMNFHQHGDDDRALVEFLKAAQENPLQVRAFYEQALIFKSKGYLKLAQSALQQALAVKPDYRDARVLLASTYFDGGDISHAASELVASLGLNISKPISSVQQQLDDNDQFINPPRSASVIQTPHGMLSEAVPAARTSNHSPPADAFSPPAQSSTGISAVAKAAIAPAVVAPVDRAELPATAFSSKESREDFSINDLLKGIPGLEGLAKSEPPLMAPATALPGVAAAVQQAVKPNSQSESPASSQGPAGQRTVTFQREMLQSGAPASPSATAAGLDPARQIQDMLKRANGDEPGKGFHLPNFFGLFSSEADNKEVKLAENPQMRALEEKAIKGARLHDRRVRKRRVAGWLDNVLDGSHADMMPDSEDKNRHTAVQIIHDDGSVDHATDVNPIEMLARAAKEKPADFDATVAEPIAPPPVPVVVPDPLTDSVQSVVKMVEDQIASVQRGAKAIVDGVAGISHGAESAAVPQQQQAAQSDNGQLDANQSSVPPALVPDVSQLPNSTSMAPPAIGGLTAPAAAQLASAEVAQPTRSAVSQAGDERALKIDAPSAAYQSDPAAIRTLEFTHKVSLATAAHQDKGAQPPSPVDFSKFFKRAVAWMPLPIFKPEPVRNDQPLMPTPFMGGSGRVTGREALPLPVLAVLKQTQAQVLPDKPAHYAKNSNRLVPSPPEIAGRPVLPMVPQAERRPVSAPTDALMNMLPKDVVATIEQMLSPKPVDINRLAMPSPPLQNVRVKSVDGYSTPAPVSAANPNVYQHLVTASVSTAGQGTSATMPGPVRQNIESRRRVDPSPIVALEPNAVPFGAPSPTASTTAVAMMPAPLPTRQQDPGFAQLPPLPVSRTAGSSELAQPQLRRFAADRAGVDLPSPARLRTSSSSFTQLEPSLPGRSQLGPAAPVPLSFNSQGDGQAPSLVAIRNAPSSSLGPSPISGQSSMYTPMVGAVLASRQPVTAPVAMPVANSAVALTPTRAPIAPLAPVQVASLAPMAPAPVASTPTISSQVQNRVTRLSSQGFKFVAPTLTAKQQHLVNALKTARPASGQVQQAKAVPVKSPAPVEDEWAKKMKYLLVNGTQSLARGEAFMYSEETGEGVLFLSGGNTIRRKIAEAQDAEQVARIRRPDILKPQGDLQYNLSLLGKIIKSDRGSAPPSPTLGLGNSVAPGLSVNEMLDRPDGFLGWLKGVFKL